MNNIICKRCSISKKETDFEVSSKGVCANICKECKEDKQTIRKENAKLLEQQSRICSSCKITKQLSDFRQGFTKEKAYYNGSCIACERIKTLEYSKKPETKEKNKLLARKRRSERVEECKIYEKSFRSNYHKSFNGYASRLYSNAVRRAFLKNLECTITSEWVHAKMKPMVCELTGIELSLNDLKDIRINPLKPTLDRIDNSKGYTPENTRVVCWWYNVMKQDWSDETVNFLITKYINNNGKH